MQVCLFSLIYDGNTADIGIVNESLGTFVIVSSDYEHIINFSKHKNMQRETNKC